MIRASKTINIDIAPTLAWNIFADLSNIHRFHPNVERATIESANSQGEGAIRVCHFYDGTQVTETVTEWVEGKSMKMQIDGMPFPIKSGMSEFSIKPRGSNACSVTIVMNYSVALGPFGFVIGHLLIKMVMQSLFKKVLKSLEIHGKTGQWIGKNGTPIAAPV